jgi:hypothetical protein
MTEGDEANEHSPSHALLLYRGSCCVVALVVSWLLLYRGCGWLCMTSPLPKRRRLDQQELSLPHSSSTPTGSLESECLVARIDMDSTTTTSSSLVQTTSVAAGIVPATPKQTRLTLKHFTLQPRESELFDMLMEVVKHFELNTVMRVAGGWVRDKLLGRVCSRQATCPTTMYH